MLPSYYKILILLSMGILFFFVPILANEPVIVINEIMYNLPGSDSKHEWIEIYNLSNQGIDLTGWRLYEAETNHNLILKQGSSIIPSQGYAVIADDAETFLVDYPNYSGILFDSVFSLNNSGEYLALKNTSLEIIDEIDYKASWGGDGNGKTLIRGSNGSWQESLEEGGSPGAENSQASPSSNPSFTPEAAQVVINELVSDPEEDQSEWVELFNKGKVYVDLEGWMLEEGSGSLTKLSGQIEAKGFFIIENPKGYLNNKGDIIILKDSSEKIVDQITYGNWDDGKLEDNALAVSDPYSLARVKDGSDTNNDFQDFKMTTTPTKGASNIITDEDKAEGENFEKNYSQDIILNEILPNPKGPDFEGEWIELKNLGEEEINLEHWQISDQSLKIYTISSSDFSSTTIPAGGFFLLPREKTKIALNNRGDKIFLYQPNGKVLDSLEYIESVKESCSYARANERWFWSIVTTPGQENIINPPNSPPEAVIEVIEEAKVGEKIIFDGSDSSDPDGRSLKYLWDFGDGEKAQEVSPSHIYQKVGLYEITLVVEDNLGLKDETRRTIQIYPPETSTIKSSGVILSEILPNPKGSDFEGEWIEIQNIGKVSVDLANWELDDGEGGSRSYKIPEEKIILPGQFLIFKREETKITLNNTYDSVRLINPQGIIISQVDYDEPLEDASYGWDGKDWRWTFKKTPGEKNVILESIEKVSSKDEKKIIETTLDKISQFELGDKIKLKGIVSVEPGILGSRIFYLAGERGIQIYLHKKDFPKIIPGDYLEVEGILSEARGERRIKLASRKAIKILDHKDPPQPKETKIDLLEESEIGSLIKLQGEITEKKGSYFWLDDGSGEIKIYLKSTTGLETSLLRIGDQIKVIGILSLSKADFCVLPRYKEDLEIIQTAEGKVSSLTELSSENRQEKVIQALVLTNGALIIILLGLGIRILRS